MNRDRRAATERRSYRLRVSTPVAPEPRGKRLDVEDLAPWVIATVCLWPRSVDDHQVAGCIGVHARHVTIARNAGR